MGILNVLFQSKEKKPVRIVDLLPGQVFKLAGVQADYLYIMLESIEGRPAVVRLPSPDVRAQDSGLTPFSLAKFDPEDEVTPLEATLTITKE